MDETRLSPAPVIDVAIVGGGVAGAYCFYRLADALESGTSPVLERMRRGCSNSRVEIRLYEMSDRVGGRLWSYEFPGSGFPKLELGGMAYHKYIHENVTGLVDELGLKNDRFPLQLLLQHMRNRTYRYGEYKPDGKPPNHYPDVVPYFLEPSERYKWPGQLINKALAVGIHGLSSELAAIDQSLASGKITEARELNSRLDNFLANARTATNVTGVNDELSTYGFWNLILDTLSKEAHAMVSNASGLFSTHQNRNLLDAALEVLKRLHVGKVPGVGWPWRRIIGGYDELPNALVDSTQREDCRIRKMCQLRRVERGKGAGHDLLRLNIRDVATNRDEVVLARNVVLALPPRALASLARPSTILQSTAFRKNLEAVDPVPASKLHLSWKKHWWMDIPIVEQSIRDGGIPFGTTDLPIRQFAFWVTNDDGPSAMMAAFTDEFVTEYWTGLLSNGRTSRISHSGPAVTAPDIVVRKALTQLSKILARRIPQPDDGVYIDWADEPFGAAWHYWRPDVTSRVVAQSIRQPVADVRLFTCGEAFSGTQGWVEGAINTAERVLECHFKLPPPTWVAPGYDFGP